MAFAPTPMDLCSGSGCADPNIYARISLSMQNKFDSKHALALWELCLDFLDKIHNYGETPFVPVGDDCRELMGIPGNDVPAI